MAKRKRFEIIHCIASPYRVHMFSEMYRQLSARGIDFHVHFMSDMSRGYDDRPKSWRNPKMDFPYTYWRDWGYSHYDFNPGMIWHLLFHRPDWLLVGSCYDTFTGILASTLCSARHAKLCWLEGNTKTPNRVQGLVASIKHFIMSRFAYVGVPGTDAIRFIALHQTHTCFKMPSPVILPNIVDESRFRPRESWDAQEIREMRSRLGVLPNELLALTPARLEPVKGLVPYLRTLDRRLLEGWKIVIIGGGNLQDEICKIIQECNLSSVVKVLGYMPYNEMPKMYAAADLFVLPSIFDPNPLSVVEALHSGLPVAVSEMAGNVDDAVAEGENGWVLPVKNSECFARTLKEVFSTTIERLQEMGKYSRMNKARFWNSRESIQNFLNAIIGSDV